MVSSKCDIAEVRAGGEEKWYKLTICSIEYVYEYIKVIYMI